MSRHRSPTDTLATILLGLGALSVAVASSAGAGAALGTLPFAALLIWAGWQQRVVGRAAVTTHASLQEITRGQMDAAEALLDSLPVRLLSRGTVMRAASYQRALIAFYRGDMTAATTAIEPAARERMGLMTQNHERIQRASAQSLRALALASAGAAGDARRDIEAVFASPHATPEALGRARLADAVVMARSGDLDGLAACFRENGSLILENVYPRERVLARALRKMLAARKRSVYREPARAREAEPSAVESWIALVAPDAAAYAAETTPFVERTAATPPPEATAAARQAVERSRAANQIPRRGPSWRHVGALWAAVVVLFVGVWALFEPGERTSARATLHAETPAAHPSPFGTFALIGVVAFLAFAAAIALAIRRNRRTNDVLLAAVRALALRDPRAAEPHIVELERQRGRFGPAYAALLRGGEAERHAAFEDVVAHADRALAHVASLPYGLRTSADLQLVPTILGLRAVALAALGRTAEANAELATLASKHGGFSHRAAYELRVRLLSAIRDGDLDRARGIARERTAELPIPLRDEALADLVIATAPSGAASDEQERLDAELREDTRLAAWIDAVAPGLREELAARRTGGPFRSEAIPDPTFDAV